MSIRDSLVHGFREEAALTRKLLKAVPQDRLEWSPHEKSMTLGQLAGHLAEMPTWIDAMIEDEMDFEAMAGDYRPFVPSSAAELERVFEENLEKFPAALEGRDDAFLRAEWTMRKGPKVLMRAPREDVIRSVLVRHPAHHRGQLTVYLRLLEVPVPATYGSTADEQVF